MKVIFFIATFFLMSPLPDIPKKMEKKIDKEVFTVFEVEGYDKELVEISPDKLSLLSDSFDPNGYFKIINEDLLLGYFYFGKAPSKTDTFDFVVIFDQDLILRKIKVLAYREDQGGEISSKRWLRQFAGVSKTDQMEYGRDIKAISGATISAESMTRAVNDLLKNLSILQE